MARLPIRNWSFAWICLLPFTPCACVMAPSQHASRMLRPVAEPIAPDVVSVERGKPNAVVDTVGWVVGIPEKILLWDDRVSNHSVSPETEAEVRDYVAQNGLGEVKVRINQYAPIDEWKRLRANKMVSPVAKYTLGTVHLVGYTLLPNRIFGGDYYNPYTNTVNVTSDVPSLAVREAAYAKDVHLRSHPSWYAFSQEFAVASIWHSAIATDETLRYYQQVGSPDQQYEAYRIISPRYGADVGGSVDSLLAISPVATVGGAVIGHIAGRAEGRKAYERALQHSEQAPFTETDNPHEGEIAPVVHRTQSKGE